MSIAATVPASINFVRETPSRDTLTIPSALPIAVRGCFGWFHQPSGVSSTTAVVICPGLRGDAVTGYRSIRLLASALAAAGYPTVRFDYPGTGDSLEPDDPDHWSAWLKSVENACDWMREHAGAERIVLCGLRMGATLAAVASERRRDVAGLALIAPVIRGRTYIRELITEITIRGEKPKPAEGLETDDFRLSGEAVRVLNELNLGDIHPPGAPQIVVFAQAASPALSNCVTKWTAAGATVQCQDFTGLEPMLRPGFMAHEPSANVSRIVEWVQTTLPAPPLDHRPDVPSGPVSLRGEAWAEEPLRFGDHDRLFGILCRPANKADSGEIVIIVNPSGDPHHGVARLNVVIARSLATRGIPSLRMDFAGLGDSIAPGDAETHIFETDRNADVTSAIDALTILGYRQFAVQGLCSGAYHAFRAALADERITDLITVNLPLFQWRTGDSVEFLSYVGASPLAQLPKLANLDSLKRLLRSDPLALYSRIAMQSTWFSGILKAFTRFSTRLFGPGLAFTFAQRSMRDLGKRGRVLLFFAEGDQGLACFEKEFSVKRPPAGVSVMIIPGMDHSLTAHEMRRTVIDAMVRFLREPNKR